MASERSFKSEVKEFLTKLCELSNYNTKAPIDAFDVGLKLHMEEDKIDRIVNYALQKGWVTEPASDFNRINSGDPPPSRRFRLIFITSQGTDKQDEVEEPEPRDMAKINSQHIGDIYTTNIQNPECSPILIGKKSTQNVVFSNEQIETLQKLLVQIERTTRDKVNEIPPGTKSQIESNVSDIKQELGKSNGK